MKKLNFNKKNSANAHCDVITDEITSHGIFKPSIAENLPVPTVKPVNTTSAETYKINNDLEIKHFEKPYQDSESIANTDNFSPSKNNHTSSSLLVNNNSCTSKAF